ncbi:hypothetical protein HDU98_004495, partial [Podochytrium sp. JEL0797]
MTPAQAPPASAATTKERRFECLQCRKGFVRYEHLLRHERIHSGEKPFACDVCDRSFGRNDELLRHLRMHRKKNE